MTQVLHGALEALHDDFAHFKTKHQTQLDQLHGDFKGTQERLNKMEVMLKRPVFSREDTPSEYSGKSAFLDFIRKGNEIPLEEKAMISQNGASGGYLIPQGMMELIHAKIKRRSPLRQLARCTTISTNTLELLQEQGEAEVGWVAETDPREETKTPEFVKVRLQVHQIYAKPRVSQILLDDAAVDIENWLAQKIAEKMAACENQAFLLGNGETMPKGILTYPVTKLGQGEKGTLESIATGDGGLLKDPDILLEVLHSLKAQYLPGAVWLMSPLAAAQVRRLKDGQGHYLWQPSLTEGSPNRLFGYPVYLSDDLPPLQQGKANVAIIFGNFKEAYHIVDRSHMSILRDPFSAKPYVEFYATKRVGGDVVNGEALKLIRFSEE